MLQFVVRILEIMAVFWLVRLLWNNLFRGLLGPQASRSRPFPPGRQYPPPEPRVVTGEMKKDPQCGTYVSTELSFKSRYRNEELHFCSRQCQEEFWKARAGKSA